MLQCKHISLLLQKFLVTRMALFSDRVIKGRLFLKRRRDEGEGGGEGGEREGRPGAVGRR